MVSPSEFYLGVTCLKNGYYAQVYLSWYEISMTYIMGVAYQEKMRPSIGFNYIKEALINSVVCAIDCLWRHSRESGNPVFESC